MISFYPPYYRYYRPHASIPPKAPPPMTPPEETPDITSTDSSSTKQEENRHYSFGPIQFKNPFFSDLEEPIFEILGIQLYLDDIIILGLLFFLYQEGVQDEMLYIALILLLLS